MRSNATSSDYTWLASDEFAVWQEVGYCFTHITDATPGEVLTTLEAEQTFTVTGVDDLYIRAGEAWDARGGGPFGKTLVAATAIGSTTLMVESTGFIGVTAEHMEPLSRGRQIVSCYYALGLSQFWWWSNGTLELHFEPLAPGVGRTGTHPDNYLQDMSEVGLDVTDSRDVREIPFNAATLALAERVTGTPIHPEMFHSNPFQLGLVQNATPASGH